MTHTRTIRYHFRTAWMCTTLILESTTSILAQEFTTTGPDAAYYLEQKNLALVDESKTLENLTAVQVKKNATILGMSEAYRNYFEARNDPVINSLSDDQILAMILELNNPYSFRAIQPTNKGLIVREGSWAVFAKPTHVAKLNPISNNLKGDLINGIITYSRKPIESHSLQDIKSSFITNNAGANFEYRSNLLNKQLIHAKNNSRGDSNISIGATGLFPNIGLGLSKGEFARMSDLISIGPAKNKTNSVNPHTVITSSLAYSAANKNSSNQYLCLDLNIINNPECNDKNTDNCIDTYAARDIKNKFQDGSGFIIHPVFSKDTVTPMSDGEAALACENQKMFASIKQCNEIQLDNKIGCSTNKIGFTISEKIKPKSPIKIEFLVIDNNFTDGSPKLVDFFQMTFERGSTEPLSVSNNPKFFETNKGVKFILLRIGESNNLKFALISEADNNPVIKTWGIGGTDSSSVTSLLKNDFEFNMVKTRGGI